MISLNTQVEEKARQEDELADLDDVRKVYGGYTEKELHIAFNLVCNKSHWKDGNRVKVSKKDLDKYADAIESAVIFYTGGGCEFYYTGEKRKTYWCEFGGYYANGMEGWLWTLIESFVEKMFTLSKK